jgi:hypothetical protein
MKPRTKHVSGATAGREVYRRWTLGGFEYRSDLIAHDYMRRWALFTPRGAVRLHKILRSDDRAHFHDHPMDFTSIILKGGYIEYTPYGPPRTFRPGDVNVRKAEDLHALELIDGGPTWTLVLAGPIRREWGFQTEDGWIVAGEYDAWKMARATKGSVSRPWWIRS